MISADEIEVPNYISVALTAERRPDADKELDGVRQTAELLSFFGILPGQRIADLMASRGYIVGCLSEIVGDAGTVWAQNSPKLIDRFKGKNPIESRIDTCGLENVEVVVSELEAPNLPGDLDLITSIMFYHDTVWVGTDRALMNRAIFNSLKPGGLFCVMDHNGPAGCGTTIAEGLHRIERDCVVDEVTAVGFELFEETDLLVNLDDPMDKLVFDKSIRYRTNRFALKFRKP